MQHAVILKARVAEADVEAVEAALFELTDSLGAFVQQEDIYFNVPHGYLKLRVIQPNHCGQLIYNSQTQKQGPKMSASNVSEVEDVDSLRNTLGLALGELGVVRKNRRLFVAEGSVRVHLDEIEEYGHFIDIAVPLHQEAETKDAKELARSVQRRLGIPDESLVPVAYLDLLFASSPLHSAESSTSDSD